MLTSLAGCATEQPLLANSARIEVEPLARYTDTMAPGDVVKNAELAKEVRSNIDTRVERISGQDSSFNARLLRDDGVLDWNFLASTDPEAERLTRLDSSWRKELDDSRNLLLGDAVSSGGSWGTAVRYAGLQFGTSAELRADVIPNTALAQPGVAALPSMADALLKDARDSKLALHGLAVDGAVQVAAPNLLSFVARDSVGRSRAITRPLLSKARLVGPGCDRFSFGVGRAREDYALVSNDYGPWLVNTTVTCGMPFGFTIEGHGAYVDGDVGSAGLDVARRLGVLGTASVALASSYSTVDSGWLTRFAFEHSNRAFDFIVHRGIQSRSFRQVGELGSDDPVEQRTLASMSFKFGRFGNVALAYATQSTFAREQTNVLALNESTQLGSGRIGVTAGHSLTDESESSVLLFFTQPLGVAAKSRSSLQWLRERDWLRGIAPRF
jgi:outer membrane usher protein FimD/PapC